MKPRPCRVVLRSVPAEGPSVPSAASLAESSAYSTLPLIQKHAPSLVEPLRAHLRGRKLGTWGLPRGPHDRNRQLWSHVQAGDVLLFSGGKRIFAFASIVGTAFSPGLAGSLWKPRSYGEGFPYLIFVGRYVDADVPYRRFNALMGYAPNFVINQFDVLNGVVSGKLIAEFGLQEMSGGGPPP